MICGCPRSERKEALLRTPVASEVEGGAVAPAVAKAKGQTLRLSGQMIDMVAPNQLPKLPTPVTTDGVDRDVANQVITRNSLQLQSITAILGMPRDTWTTTDLSANKTQQIGNGARKRQAILPTPTASDWKNGRPSDGYGPNLPQAATDLMPTPTTRDYKDGSQPHERNGKVQTDTVARAVFNSGEINLPTPTASDWKGANHSGSGSASSRSMATVVEQTNWGKFEPAIRRWEAIIGRPAPEPTKPDGKDGNHRLSSKFTEWMMGLPDGWITGHDLKRNDELKLAGNGVVPQQAELALRLLLELPEREK